MWRMYDRSIVLLYILTLVHIIPIYSTPFFPYEEKRDK